MRVHEPVSIIDLLDVGGTTHSWGLHQALATIAAARSGVIVLLHRPESSQELLERSRAVGENVRLRAKYDLRNYGIGAQILRDLGVRRMRLLAIPRKMPSMTGFGLEVTGYLQPEGGAQP